MIKPSQIREKEFAKSTMGGYKTSDVNSFLNEVADSYERLYKENSELLKKLRLLVENIEQYRNREQDNATVVDKSLSDAGAQAEKIIAEARLEAERIISDAKSQSVPEGDAQASLDEIRQLRAREEKALANVRAEVERFRKSLLSMYTEHLTIIQSMMSAAPAKQDVKQPVEQQIEQEVEQPEQEPVEQPEQEVQPTEQIADCQQDAQEEASEDENSEEEMNAFFADAVSDEQSRRMQAFGGFRFEMGVENTDEVQLEIEAPQDAEAVPDEENADDVADEEESDFPAENEEVHSDAEESPEIIVLGDEPVSESVQEAQPIPQQNYQPSHYDMEIQDEPDDLDDVDDSEQIDDSDDQEDDDKEMEPSFKISFPMDSEAGNNEDENLDDLFEGFFNSFDKN